MKRIMTLTDLCKKVLSRDQAHPRTRPDLLTHCPSLKHIDMHTVSVGSDSLWNVCFGMFNGRWFYVADAIEPGTLLSCFTFIFVHRISTM